MTYSEILEAVNTKLSQNVTILKNGEIHCYAANGYVGTDICAIIEPFNGDQPGFDVILKERNPDLVHSSGFDDINKFVITFKKIIDNLNRIDEIIDDLMFFQIDKIDYNFKNKVKENNRKCYNCEFGFGIIKNTYMKQ